MTTLRDADLKDKRVLVRFDGDVPVQDGKIHDTYRLEAVLPTLRFCREQGASVVLLAHRGRPDGKPDPSLSNGLLADYFTQELGESVVFVPEVAPKTVPGPLVLLENLRFDPGEEKNDPRLAQTLARLGDVYCNDAFAVSHRAHASVVGLAKLLPHYAGFRLSEEINQLQPLLDGADIPYCVVLGGAKASDKSSVIAALVSHVDTILLGGLVAVTYLAAMGQSVGAHEVEQDQVKLAQSCIRAMHETNVQLMVPVDYINQDKQTKLITQFGPKDLMIDIGPQTVARFGEYLHKANTIFWNGAMGKSEDPAFAKGTIGVAQAIAYSGADARIASGGDTVGAIHEYNVAHAFTFISTGGGATLEFLAGKELPGIKALVT
jgi:phosphoglycerate kinase